VVTPADVVRALSPGSAIVDLLVHRAHLPARFEGGAFIARGEWSEPRVSAWVLHAGDPAVRHVDLGPAAPIEEAITAHLRGIAGGGEARGVSVDTSDRATGSGSSARDGAGGALRTLLWDPLREALGDARTAFVSPDGALGTLPFETLRDDGGRYLVEDRDFVYVPDGSALVELTSAHPSLGDSLLAVGGVDYARRAPEDRKEAAAPASPPPARVATARSRGEPSRAFADGWIPLPATIPEVRGIAATFARARADGSLRLLLGADATEEGLKVAMPRHAILHLATHGFFQPEGLPSMWEQALDAVSGERGGGMLMTETATRLTGLHPGLLSGLVLAGVNRPPGEDEDRDDGYLTASEVTLLDLSGVELAVLSACETGLGRPQSGEGLLGLRRAFHMAGATIGSIVIFRQSAKGRDCAW